MRFYSKHFSQIYLININGSKQHWHIKLSSSIKIHILLIKYLNTIHTISNAHFEFLIKSLLNDFAGYTIFYHDNYKICLLFH